MLASGSIIIGNFVVFQNHCLLLTDWQYYDLQNIQNMFQITSKI